MPRLEIRRRFFPTLIALSIALTACADDNPLGPDSQVQISSAPDNFLLQVRFMEDGTDDLIYNWGNTGTQAAINISQTVGSGSVVLIIKDHEGTVVHQDDITTEDSADTAVGVTGDWTIEIHIVNATGTFTISVIKKT